MFQLPEDRLETYTFQTPPYEGYAVYNPKGVMSDEDLYTFYYIGSEGLVRMKARCMSLEDAREQWESMLKAHHSFWAEKVRWKENGDKNESGYQAIRSGGTHMVIGREDPDNPFRGFGGRQCKFRLLETGEVIESTNVWYQGRIPSDYKLLLPDNAELV